MPTANAVSRRLGQKFQRSTQRPSRIKGMPFIKSGFSVFSDLVRESDGSVPVYVTYHYGDNARHMSSERRSIVFADNLSAYRAYLETWYRVEDDATETRSAQHLIVYDKGEKA